MYKVKKVMLKLIENQYKEIIASSKELQTIELEDISICSEGQILSPNLVDTSLTEQNQFTRGLKLKKINFESK